MKQHRALLDQIGATNKQIVSLAAQIQYIEKRDFQGESPLPPSVPYGARAERL